MPLFELGRIVGTDGANEAIPSEAMLAALKRHRTGDWGDVSLESAQENGLALKNGGRLISVYLHGGIRFWVVTDSKRSRTTVLLPEEF